MNSNILFIVFLISYIIYLSSIFYIMITTEKYKTSKDFYIDWFPGGYALRSIVYKITQLENNNLDE